MEGNVFCVRQVRFRGIFILSAMQETHVRSLGQEDPPEEGVAAHSFFPGEVHGPGLTAGCSPGVAESQDWATDAATAC